MKIKFNSIFIKNSTWYLHIVCSLCILQYSTLVPTVDGVVAREVVGLTAGVVVSGRPVCEVMGGDNVDAEGRNVLAAQSPS